MRTFSVSSDNLPSEASIFSTPDKLSYSFLSLDKLPTFYSLYFQCCKIPSKILRVWSFWQTLLPLGHLLSVLPPSSFPSVCVHQAFSHAPPRPLRQPLLLFHHHTLLQNTLLIQFKFPVYCYCSLFLCYALIFFFVKCHVGLSCETEKQHNCILSHLGTDGLQTMNRGPEVRKHTQSHRGKSNYICPERHWTAGIGAMTRGQS